MSERKIGYACMAHTMGNAREQLEEQIERLTSAGCSEVFSDFGISGARLDRPSLTRALATLQPGDTLLVCAVDRLSRDHAETYRLVDKLMARGVEFEALDTPDAAAALRFKVNYAPDPAPDTSIVRYAAFKIGSFLVRWSRLHGAA